MFWHDICVIPILFFCVIIKEIGGTMTPNEFANWKIEELDAGNIPLSKEDFEFVQDMMAMQNLSDYDPNDEETKKNTIFKEDGMALVQGKNGLEVFYTDLETIKYEQVLRKQKRKKSNRLYIVK